MRSYTVAAASLAIEAPAKWTDNLLSQHDIPNVVSRRRGVARRISYQALVRLALIRHLHMRLGLSVTDSVRLARELLDSGQNTVHVSRHLELIVDLAGLERTLNARLADVLESAPVSRRGRPLQRPGT